MTDLILVINAGSSSLKFSVYEASKDLDTAYRGQIDGIGTHPRFRVRDAEGRIITDETWLPVADGQGHALAFSALGKWLQQQIKGSNLVAVGHRVVHGGPELSAPVLIGADSLAKIEAAVPLMPLHLPHNLRAIHAIAEVQPDLPQIACFDTAFHRGHPQVADLYALPMSLYSEGIRRYGFHGLSYEYINRRIEELAPELSCGRVVIAHLGSGASMCALRDGHSMEASMGFSALDGLPMGTRCGAIDPGVILYLMRHKHMNAAQIETLLYRQSGLAGLSGLSNDLRELLVSDSEEATRAIDYFVYRINRELGAMFAALGGLDGLVFTAGIGENSPQIRRQVCQLAAWSGISLDEIANQKNQLYISRAGSSPSVLVIPTDEEKMIATHTFDLLGAECLAAS